MGGIHAWLSEVVQLGHTHGSLFQLLPRVLLLLVHFLWKTLLQFLQVSGCSLTFVAVSDILERQKEQDQDPCDTDEDRIALLIWSIDC